MYVKPTLQRYGTFREVTRNNVGPGFCIMFPSIPWCSTSVVDGPEGGEQTPPEFQDRS